MKKYFFIFCLNTMNFAYAKKLALAGDSTVSTYSSSSAKQGWGYSLHQFSSTELDIVNFAQGGASTKSFRTEGRWKKLLKSKPDFIFVQFGHNDSNGSFVSLSNFKTNLQKFIDEAITENSEIYFVTPPHRCKFKNGKVTDELKPYVDAMISVATNNKIGLLNLYKKSGIFLNSIGTKACREFYQPTAGDNTHFNKKGSKKIAQLLADEASGDPALSEFFYQKD